MYDVPGHKCLFCRPYPLHKNKVQLCITSINKFLIWHTVDRLLRFLHSTNVHTTSFQITVILVTRLFNLFARFEALTASLTVERCDEPILDPLSNIARKNSFYFAYLAKQTPRPFAFRDQFQLRRI